LDEPHDAPVRNPVLDKLHQPAVVDGIKSLFDVYVISVFWGVLVGCLRTWMLIAPMRE